MLLRSHTRLRFCENFFNPLGDSDRGEKIIADFSPLMKTQKTLQTLGELRVALASRINDPQTEAPQRTARCFYFSISPKKIHSWQQRALQSAFPNRARRF
jgi:hypothetical protein